MKGRGKYELLFLKTWWSGPEQTFWVMSTWLAESPTVPKTQHGSELDLSFVAASNDSPSLVHCVRWLLVP